MGLAQKGVPSLVLERAARLGETVRGVALIGADGLWSNVRRHLRTARVQLQSRAIGEHIYHPAGAHAELRKAVMRAKTPDDRYDTIDWLYGSTGREGAVSLETRRG